MADTVRLRDPDSLRAYAAQLAEVRTTLGGIGAATHTSVNGALAPMDTESYPRTYINSPPAYIPPEYQKYAQGYGGVVNAGLSPGWGYLSDIKAFMGYLAYADDGLVTSLTAVAGDVARTVAAQVHVAREAAARIPETDAGGAAALQGIVAEAVATVPPPPEKPEPDPRFTPRTGNR